MGLLGTIFGMILAFQTVATSGEALGKAELLAKGIYQAMITTAAGLSLAIPVVVAYHYFSSKIERLVLEMDQLTVEFLEDFTYPDHIASETGPKLLTTKSGNGSSHHPADSLTEQSQNVSSRASA